MTSTGSLGNLYNKASWGKARRRRNAPFVVWAAFFLWFISIFAIAWSSFLFFCLGEILLISGTDLVNLFVLLSGLIMLPTNMQLLYSISNGKRVDHKMPVGCCPLWMCIVWIVLINLGGAAATVHKMISCCHTTNCHIADAIKYYRSVPKYKHFMDNLQWSLKCCGLDSYKDWFAHDWYDRIRDYEWDPAEKREASFRGKSALSDSVPLSCCKSGSCVASYLSELGTYAINTGGCGRKLQHLVMVCLYGHLFFFALNIILELALLKYVMYATCQASDSAPQKRSTDVRHIMTAKDNFDTSCTSETNLTDTTDVDRQK